MKFIVTHPGSAAHKDDFLACCILAHLHGVTIHRREPTEDDLSTPDTCVVDTGGIHDVTLKNFDHHHFLAMPHHRVHFHWSFEIWTFTTMLWHSACGFVQGMAGHTGPQ